MKALNCIFKAKKNNIRSGEWNLHRSWSNIHPHPKFKTGLSTQPRYTEALWKSRKGVRSNWEWVHKKTNSWIREGLGWWGERSSRCWAPGQVPHKQRVAGWWSPWGWAPCLWYGHGCEPRPLCFLCDPGHLKFLRILVNSITFPLAAQNPPCHFLVIFKTAE